MRNVKQFLAVLLAATMIAGSSPVTLSAAGTRNQGSLSFAEAERNFAVSAEETGSDPAANVIPAAEDPDTSDRPENEQETADSKGSGETGDISEKEEESSDQPEEAEKAAGSEADASVDSASAVEEVVSVDIEAAAEDVASGDTETVSADSKPAEAENGAASADSESALEEAVSGVTEAAAEDAASGDTDTVSADPGPAEAENEAASGESVSASEAAASGESVSASEEAAGAADSVTTPAANESTATYTVTLDANGGGYYIDYNNNNAHVQTVTHTGEPEDRDISAYQIPKANPGKIFAGWSTTANGTALPTGTTVTSNLYLYAVWEQGCAVTLNANGGHFTLEDGTQADTIMATVEQGESIFSYSFVSSGSPEAEGKRFAGYGRMVNGSVTLLPSTGGTGYTVSGEKLTLYAVWINVCEITYNANGGGYFTGLTDSSVQSSTFTETLDEGEKVYNMSFINLVTNEGCTFKGWSLKADGTAMLSSSGYTVGTGSLTLYAVWDGETTSGSDDTEDSDDTEEPEETDDPEETVICEVTYDANGGQFPREGRVRPKFKTVEVNKGDTISLLDSSNYGGTDPSMTNCEFAGWSDAADSTELLSQADYTSFTVTQDITIYAVWTTTLTFEANGGSFAGGETVTDTVFLGTTVNLGSYEVPERTGFTFKGWAENDTGTSTVSQNYLIDEDNVAPYLYAVWEEGQTAVPETCTLTLDANGGYYDTETKTVYTKTVEKGTVIDLSDYEPDYDDWEDFAGWSLTRGGAAISSADSYTVQKNVTLYAIWIGKIGDAKIELSKTSMAYTGAAQTPAVTVVYGEEDRILTEGTDYTLTCSNNINAGTATVVIKGVDGRFTGSVTKNFTITRISQTLTLKAAASSVTVNKTVKLTAGGAKETTDYTFSSSNTSLATVASSGAIATVTGVKGGTVVITVTTPQTTNYLKTTKKITLTVIPGTPAKPGKCRFVRWQNSKYSRCLIAWNKVSGASGYQTILTWTDGSHAVVKNVKPDMLQQSCDVAVNHVSQFRVRAYVNSAAGRKYGAWSNVEYITPSPTKLTVKKQGSSSGTRKANISWNIIYGCNGYNVFVTTNPNGTWYWNQSTDVSAKSTSAVITKYRSSKLKKGVTYYVRIVTRRKRNGVFCTVPMPASNTYIGTFRF